MDNEQNNELSKQQSATPFGEFGESEPESAETNPAPAPFEAPAPIAQQPVEKKTLKSKICGIVYPVILILLAVILFSVGVVSVIGLILSILSSIGLGVLMFVGGFYFYIIPLPIIYVYGFGCDRHYASNGKKIGLGFLCAALGILSIAIMFVPF